MKKSKDSVIVDKNREVVRASFRVPQKKESIETVYKRVCEETGFLKSDIKKVVRCFFREVNKTILDKRSINIPNLGFFFPTITMRRIVKDFTKKMPATNVEMKPRWVLRYKPTRELYAALGELDYTQEEFEDIVYRK